MNTMLKSKEELLFVTSQTCLSAYGDFLETYLKYQNFGLLCCRYFT